MLARARMGVTFDWWGTLFEHRDTTARRVQLIVDSLAAEGISCEVPTVRAAYERAAARFDEEWRSGRVYPPSQWLDDILAALGCPLPPARHALLLRQLEEAMLADPPRLLPGAAELLQDLHAQGIALGIVSDTGLTVGRVMREILRRCGLLSLFGGFSFSDEVGVTKPHPQAFITALRQMGLHPEQAVHVGDLPQTDIRGAKQIGMRAVLITAVTGACDDGLADAIVRDHYELRALLCSWGFLRR